MPTSKTGKTVAVIWLISCSLLLIFAYLQRDIYDMPVAFTWMILLISGPIGFILAPAIGMSAYYFYELFEIVYNPFLDVLLTWLVLVPAGYVQWFIVVPKLFKWSKSKWKSS